MCLGLNDLNTVVFDPLSFGNLRFLKKNKQKNRQNMDWSVQSFGGSGLVPPVLQMLSSSLISQI